jgi:hypothetical protein
MLRGPIADKVVPCSAEVQWFVVIDQVDKVEAMFPMVGGIGW